LKPGLGPGKLRPTQASKGKKGRLKEGGDRGSNRGKELKI